MRSIMLRKIIAGALISCIVFGAVGCTDKNTVGDGNSNIVSENLDNQQSNNNEEDNIENQESLKTTEMLLYSKDVNTDEQLVLGEVEVNEDLSLEEKLKKLSKEFSEKVFDNLPIQFVKFNNIEGKKIALFNLDELGNNAADITFDKYEGTSWINNYFVGSAGGSVTEYTLITTLLQKNYTGEWIDGVEFTYKNSNIEFDHVPALGEITYR